MPDRKEMRPMKMLSIEEVYKAIESGWFDNLLSRGLGEEQDLQPGNLGKESEANVLLKILRLN